MGLCAYVRREGIDVVHSLDRVRDSVAGQLVARLGGARLVIHMHAKLGEWVSPLAKTAMLMLTPSAELVPRRGKMLVVVPVSLLLM